ncbi:MAG TPA: hypothetical protein VMD53_03895 [Rhizomicrobium sp.]|nr:hypothetical protein [Rhizomicrobium sp.]
MHRAVTPFGSLLTAAKAELAELSRYIIAFIGVIGVGATIASGLAPQDAYAIYAGSAVLVLGYPVAWVAWAVRRRQKEQKDMAKPQLPFPELMRPHDKETLRTEVITTLAVLKIIQEQVVPAIFGTSTPPNEEVYAMYEKNSRRSIALYSDNERAYVGFASIWLLTDAAADKLLRGEANENQLTRYEILPYEQKNVANYAIIPGIGVMEPQTEKGRARAKKLIFDFKRFIEKEYFDSSDKTLTIIATGYSTPGTRWCEDFFKMKFERMIDFGNNERHPLYSMKVTRETLGGWGTVVETLT